MNLIFISFFSIFYLTIIQAFPSDATATPINLQISSNWGNGLCGNLQFTNPTNQVAHSFIITMKVCKGTLTSSWGSTLKTVLISQEGGVQTYVLTGQNLQIQPNACYTDIGFCMSNEPEFDPNQSIILGLDLKTSNSPDCNGEDCDFKCGDGICSVCETVENCAIDCKPKQCVINQDAGAETWPGIVSYTTTSYWFPYMCIDLNIQNPDLLRTGVSYLLQVKSCYPAISISAFWGYDQQLISNDGTTAIYKQVANNINWTPQFVNSGGSIGMCLIAKLNSFSFNQHFIFQVEFRNKNLPCTAATCNPTCGNGICDPTETQASCPIDCAPFICP